MAGTLTNVGAWTAGVLATAGVATGVHLATRAGTEGSPPPGTPLSDAAPVGGLMVLGGGVTGVAKFREALESAEYVQRHFSSRAPRLAQAGVGVLAGVVAGMGATLIANEL